jgi:hypothetical protein
MARGSIFRKDGRWAFRVDAGFHADSGKRRQVLRQGFATKRAAEAALADMVGDAARGTAVSTSTTKLGAYLDDWFATAKQSLRPTTAHGYQQAILRLQQRLGPYRLQALTPDAGAALLHRVAPVRIEERWAPGAGHRPQGPRGPASSAR